MPESKQYVYGNIEDAKPGDIVERIKGSADLKRGSLYTVKEHKSTNTISIKDHGNYQTDFFKLVLTKPGIEAKVKDTVICTGDTRDNGHKIGNVSSISHVFKDNTIGIANETFIANTCDYLVLCMEEEEEETIPQLKPRVAIVTNDVSGHPVGSRIIKIGNAWTLELDSEGDCWGHTIGNSCEWEDELMEKPQDEYKPKYKIGDTIQTDYDWYPESKIVIRDIKMNSNELTYYYKDINGEEKGMDECITADNADHFHLIEPEAEPELNRPLEKGDTVRYIGPRNDSVEEHRPDTCIALGVSGTQLRYKKGHSCHIKYWELVEDDRIQSQFKVGDRVQLNAEARENFTNPNMDATAFITHIELRNANSTPYLKLSAALLLKDAGLDEAWVELAESQHNDGVDAILQIPVTTVFLGTLEKESPLYEACITTKEIVMEPHTPRYKVGDVLDASKAWTVSDNSALVIGRISKTNYHFTDGGHSSIKGTDSHSDIYLVRSNEPASPQNKENTMNPNISVTMTAKELKKYEAQNSPSVPKTQLEAAAKHHTQWFNVDGKQMSSTTQSPKAANKELQRPDRIGWTFRTYEIAASKTTAIPTTEVKL